MKRYFIDTNVFVEVLMNRDRNKFSDSTDLLKRIKENEIKAITTNTILAELVWVLKSFYGINKQKIIEALKSICGLSGMKIISLADLSMAIKLYEEKKVKFIDALVASIEQIRDKKWTVVSYDKDFDRLKVVRMEPGEIK